ncbi:hypothetical protein DM02DRAFT_214262 [Periconia macrospinosa]|uniref:Uncharacterized protein n=1 Tax=Periconia macrospinosa TaxID=97972 RepID=A0A2V1E063_9PLEO|nr:hypothetical protein DM02DRAFT_214262 [Periconia macrospinosa]
MESAREPVWSEHEKVYMLAEILKAHPVPSHVLYNFIRDAGIQPKWNEMALPHGRSVRSCQMAYGDLVTTYTTPPDYRRPQPQIPTPILYPGPELPKKRPLQPETSTPIGRVLQPRPPHSYQSDFISGPTYPNVMSPLGEPANKKKRGRPTKAEAQQRAQEAAARGEPYPPPRKARPSITAMEQSLPAQGDSQPPPQAHAQAQAQAQQTPPPAPTSYSGAITPQPTQPDQAMELSSSGKKKRSKPAPLELEKSQKPPGETDSPLPYGSATTGTHQSQAYSSFTPISAPLPTELRDRDRDVRMEGVEESQPRTTTPHSFKDTVGI